MSFFLPRRLVEFEYFGGEKDEEYEKIAKPYQNDIDFAFFAVNFGYSYSDYCQLTPRQKIFIYKAYENKYVTELMSVYNAAFAAFYNVNRPKRKKPLNPLKRRTMQAVDKEQIINGAEVVQKIEKKNGKSWIDKIYKANGLKRGGK